MYKARIQKWGIDKKSKEKEMRAIARKQKQRRDGGKDSSFRVRGRSVDYETVVHYWQRKRMNIEDVIAQRSASATPEAIECLTPVPSPVTPAPMFAIPERVFGLVKDYYQGSFQSGTWVLPSNRKAMLYSVKDEENGTPNLEMFARSISLAFRLFDIGESRAAGRLLIASNSNIDKILQVEHPETIVRLFCMTVLLFRSGRGEIAVAILRQCSAVGKVILGINHPLHFICQCLSMAESSQLTDITIRTYKVIQDLFRSEIGSLQASTVNLRAATATLECDNEALRNLVDGCENSLGVTDPRSLLARIALALSLHKYPEALQACQLTQNCTGNLQSGDAQVADYLSTSIYYSANACLGMQGSHMAKEAVLRAVDLALSTPNYSGASLFLTELEGYLIKSDQIDLVRELRDRRRWMLELAYDQRRRFYAFKSMRYFMSGFY